MTHWSWDGDDMNPLYPDFPYDAKTSHLIEAAYRAQAGLGTHTGEAQTPFFLCVFYLFLNFQNLYFCVLLAIFCVYVCLFLVLVFFAVFMFLASRFFFNGNCCLYPPPFSNSYPNPKINFHPWVKPIHWASCQGRRTQLPGQQDPQAVLPGHVPAEDRRPDEVAPRVPLPPALLLPGVRDSKVLSLRICSLGLILVDFSCWSTRAAQALWF